MLWHVVGLVANQDGRVFVILDLVPTGDAVAGEDGESRHIVACVGLLGIDIVSCFVVRSRLTIADGDSSSCGIPIVGLKIS